MPENKTTTTNSPNTESKDTNILDLSNFSVPVAQNKAPNLYANKPVETNKPNTTPNTATFNLDEIQNPNIETTVTKSETVKQNISNSSTVNNVNKLNIALTPRITTTAPTETMKPASITTGWLNLWSLNITQRGTSDQNTEKTKTNAIFASVVDGTTVKTKKKGLMTNVQIIIAWYIIIIVSILASIGINEYTKYIDLENQVQPDSSQQQLVDNINNISKFLSKYTKIDDYVNRADQTNLLISDDKDTIVNTIKNNANLNYTQKRIVLQNNISTLDTNIITNQKALDDVKSEIQKYGFIPKALYDMTQKEEWISGIRSAMLLRENLKFITAFKVFGYMQSFIAGFANDSNMDPVQAETQLKALNNNWEKDIITYTNNCYFNPYEIGDNCAVTNDFNNYYQIIDTKSTIDPEFVKKLASYADRKLQEKDIPSYAITFPEFNPKLPNVQFTTDINTNKQDELALNQIGVVNPHLYIITNLINTLKQSLLVIWENIKVDQIKIVPKTVRVWTTIFTINSSTLNFDLPIQKPYEREISDYFSTTPSK